MIKMTNGRSNRQLKTTRTSEQLSSNINNTSCIAINNVLLNKVDNTIEISKEYNSTRQVNGKQNETEKLSNKIDIN